MDADEPAVTLVSEEHCFIDLNNGQRRVAIEASWKRSWGVLLDESNDETMVRHDHFIQLTCPQFYKKYVSAGLFEANSAWWSSYYLEPAKIDIGDGVSACFYCALAKVVPDIKFPEILEIYLNARAQFEGDYYKTCWLQCAQRFYEERVLTCHVKPAKS